MRAEDKLDCNESQSLIAAYIDGELDSSSAIRYGAHLEACPACSEAYRQMCDLQATVKAHATHYAAPAHLRQRIQAALPHPAPRARKFSKLPWTWINFGVAGKRMGAGDCSHPGGYVHDAAAIFVDRSANGLMPRYTAYLRGWRKILVDKYG